MSALTVYRVEDAQGIGPYWPQSRYNEVQDAAAMAMANRHTDVKHLARDISVETAPHLHPGPGQDYDMRNRWYFMDWSDRRGSRNYLFGFLSQRRLGEWFFGERDTLELLDMHVAAYEVAHQAVVRGQWQLAFRKQSARRVATFELAGLVE